MTKEQHTHVVTAIELRGKSDSVVVKCGCGFEDVFGSWYTRPVGGWAAEQWPQLTNVIQEMLKLPLPNCEADVKCE